LALRYDWRNNAFVSIHNLGSNPREISLEVATGRDQPRELVSLLSEHHSHADDNGRHRILLEPYGYRWYRVGGLDYLLKRSEI
jgi:maltose alpha-D-glucosyltransferase / alpha-amylase